MAAEQEQARQDNVDGGVGGGDKSFYYLAGFLGLLLVAGLFFLSTQSASASGAAVAAPLQQQALQAQAQATASQQAGSATYIPYSKQEFDKARSEGKVVFLDFYAGWCPNCHRQEPEIRKAFSDLKLPVAGFKVDYDSELGLRREYGVPYQNTKVVLDRQGSVAFRSPAHMSSDEIQGVLQKAAGA